MRLPSSHQALVRSGNALQVQEVPTHLPQPGGLLIALQHVGVCGTDLQILNGTRPDTAAVLGHEGVGVVAWAGRGAQMRPGDLVVFNPVAELSAGRLLGHNVAGLFQQFMTVDAQAVNSGLVLPAQACNPPSCGALAEPLGAAIYAYDLVSRVVPRLRTVAVFGAGPVGLLATGLLNALGARVFLVHPSRARLDTAIEAKTIDASAALTVSEELPKQLLALNNGGRVDAALICTTRQGAPLALRHALEIVASDGCIDLITNYPEGTPAPHGLHAQSIRAVRAANVCGVPSEGNYLYADVSNRRIALTGHRGTSAAHLNRAMHELRSRAATYGKLITHVLSLHTAAAAIEILANSGERWLDGRDCVKAVIDLTPTH